ncbi:MAG: zinc ribbon domain-containing protein [Pseudomonadota bacterium]
MNYAEATCPECAETIKAAAKVCKHCGYRIDAELPASPVLAAELTDTFVHRPMQFKPWHALAGVAATIAVVGGGIWNSRQIDERFRADSPTVEAAGISFFKKDLKDPASAQFVDLSSSTGCLTGKFNAKNSFGAYTGFVDFYYDARKRAGRTSPGMPATGLANASAFDAGLKDYEAYNREVSVCLSDEAAS